jgi:pimeloyl-ACP methyl ester carboxylesterase
MTRHYCHIGNRTIAYLDSSPKSSALRALVLLHAFPLGAGMWEPQLKAVPPGWRLIAPDLRGFGGSTDPDSAGVVSMDDYAADVVDLLGELHIPRAVVGGCSMGGYAAFALVRNAPALVEGLILLDTKAGADSGEGRANRRNMLALVDREGPSGVAREMIPKLIGRTTRETNAEIEAVVRRLIKQQSSAAVRGAILRMMDRPDSTPVLPKIRVPTLVVVGREDELTPVAESERIAAEIPGARFMLVPAAGHLASLERPDVVNGILSDFLSSLPS